MFIDLSTKISEYVSLDASLGPIVIQDHVTIQPFSRIVGPCFVGSYSTINSHSDIQSSYIGNHCKIGGEVKIVLSNHLQIKPTMDLLVTA